MDQSIDKSARSVFVGNIPYEATEEKLKEIFASVGPVLSFKLVYDRENGKPRGYGFCEFMDQETAMSAMRNLNGQEISGRALRVDSASNERSANDMPMPSAAGPSGPSGPGFPGLPGPPTEPNPYGESVDPDKAPEAISKAVASLPPEQMFELMKQMQQCVKNNPQEARDMLLKNPQLAYALLQALVVMRTVDPEMALSMLHKQAPKPMLLGVPPSGPPAHHMGGDRFHQTPPNFDHGRDMRMEEQRYGGRDHRDHRERDPRDRYSERDHRDRDPRERDPRSSHRDRDPRDIRGDPRDSRGDPRDPRDPRDRSGPSRRPGPEMSGYPPQIPAALASSDPEKAQLIMQVLQLTDQQIANLPPEQQQSILELKKQVLGAK